MKIQSINYKNNTNFGVNFINKPKWNEELLKTLEKSELVKNIDKKYPNAFMKYSKGNITGLKIVNDEPNYSASLIIGLDKNKVTAYNINSYTSEGADKTLNRYISRVSLSDVEKITSEKVRNINHSIEIVPVKKQNFVSRFISKIFG